MDWGRNVKIHIALFFLVISGFWQTAAPNVNFHIRGGV
jgi:hypothetical protein